MHDDILGLAYEAIDEINRQLPGDRQVAKTPTTALLGDGSQLDSLSLINFIVAFEERLEHARARRFDLLEEQFLGDPAGPLRDIGSLVAFVGTGRG